MQPQRYLYELKGAHNMLVGVLIALMRQHNDLAIVRMSA